jgi:hypothetical protein
VHLRRALLLFAIVLGVAALVASLNRPRESSGPDPDTDTPPPASPRATPARPPVHVATLRFSAGDRAARTRRLEAGRAATVVVEVEADGQAEIAGLALIQPAAPETPARFDVLTDEPGVYPVVFTPAASGVRVRAGTLVVGRPRRRAVARPAG